MVDFKSIERFVTSLSFLIFLLPISPALAKSLLSVLKFKKSCPAFQSFRKKTNPGNVTVKEGNNYSIIQKSKKGTHYRVRIEGIERQERWIESRCGIKTNQCGTSITGKNVIKPVTLNSKNKKAKSGQYLLALSWVPTFCEARPNKKECKSLVENRYDATPFITWIVASTPS